MIVCPDPSPKTRFLFPSQMLSKRKKAEKVKQKNCLKTKVYKIRRENLLYKNMPEVYSGKQFAEINRELLLMMQDE